MKLPSILTIATAFLALTSFVSADTTTIYYPNQKEAVFSIEAPDDWHFEAGTEENPYCTLSKGDTVLYFRAMEGTEESIKEAIEETYEYVQETYPKAELPEPKETKIAGKEALAAAGGGKDKEGTATQFGFAWVFVSDDHIAELWFEVPETDEKLAGEAGKILKSFKVPAAK